MNKNTSITAEMTISQIFDLFPQHREELFNALANAGLHCGCCSHASCETLQEGMISHGMKAEEIAEIIFQLNEIVSNSPASTISLTQIAAQKFKEFAEEEGKAGCALRFGIIPSCCSSEYILAFSDKPQEDDQVFESYGVQIHVNKEMAKSLLGTRIDYREDGEEGGGFAIANPNKRSHGCGGCGGGSGCCSH